MYKPRQLTLRIKVPESENFDEVVQQLHLSRVSGEPATITVDKGIVFDVVIVSVGTT